MRLHSFALVSRLAPACTTALLAAPILLAGCSSKWSAVDGDGDGVTLAQGDCNDGSGDIFPGATELWYDGVDSDCSGGSDFDKDGDGVGAIGHTDEQGVEGTDCWDDPDTIPGDYTASAGMDQLGAVDVHPDAEDVYYDDIDANCDGASDFDQDGDGFDSGIWPDSDGVVGDDCYDELDADCVVYDGTEADCTYPVSGPFQGEPIDPFDIHPTATDSWYDGTDQDCAGNDDYDQDYDTFPSYEECDDTNADIYPNPSIPEVWYNGFDENCDGNDADQDGDTFLEAGYSGAWPHNMSFYSTGDCWDDPADSPDWLPINGFASLSADDVNPDADETWYDSLDQDCAGNDDFDQDADGYKVDNYRDASGTYGDDCDDLAGDTNPGAVDAWYDNVDADCQGNNDFDQDGDGYGQDGSGLGEDCDDTDRLVSPAGTETCATPYDDDCDTDDNDLNAASCTVRYYDGDRDTYGTTSTECRCDAAGSYDASVSTDCDDASATDYPGATETTGNQDDENCDGGEICFDDDDNDGYLDATGDTRISTDTDCADAYEGTDADPTTDCDDTDLGDHPGATETVGNQDDEDCDGGEICYNDDDNDNYLDTTADTIASVDTDCTDSYEGTNTDVTTDCDDADSFDHPGATETVGNQDDEDCDGGEICYNDDDNDTYLDATGDTIVSSNTSCLDAYEGTNTDLTTDCDDADAGDYPGASETVGNQDDEDCDGGEICYDDDDNDGYLDTTADTRVSTDADCADSYEAPSTDATTDCDDFNAAANPSASEIVGDGIDEDCNTGEICYNDDDNDGYLDTTGDTIASTNTSCADAYEGTNTDLTTDCDDADSGDHPGATETVGNQDDEDCDGGEICYNDDDNDNYLDATADTIASADTDCTDSYEGTNADVTTDCDDTDAGDNPSATETVGNQDDEDCNGGEICYNDDDNDGYLDTTGDTIASTNTSCADAYEGTNTDLTTDCDDADSGDHPGATETVGNQDDEDCDGGEICYNDDDNDNYLDATADTIVSADTDCTDSYEGTNTDVTTDCDDADSGDYPGATETVGNQDDEDCNGGEICYNDDDNDGYLDTTGDTIASTNTSCADAYEGTNTDLTTDCNDAVATIYPSATESCNDIDDDCDGTADDGLTLYYPDSDGDGNGAGTGDCSVTSGITSSTDCDDADRYVYTGAPEMCDNQYNNCTGSGSWSTASELGEVSVNNGTTWTDITSTFSGTSSAPGSRTLASGDTLYLCGTATVYGRVSATGVDATVTAMNGSPTLDGGSTAGSAISVNGGHVNVSSLTLRHGGGTSGYGGAVYAVASSAPSASTYTVYLASTTVWQGSASYGGGIAIDDYASVKLASTTIQANTATQQGGGIWMDTNARLETITTNITQNAAGTYGGGIYMGGGTLSTSGSLGVTSNTAATSGGGIYMAGGTATLTGTSTSAQNTFTSNTATNTSGGAIYIGGGSWTSYYNSITSNTAGGDGGGVTVAGGTATFSSTSTVGTNIAGDDGGGYYQSGGTLNIGTSHTISNNDASGIGGGAAFRGGTATFSAGTVISGNATGGTIGGGGLGITNATVALTTPSISNNDAAAGDGGGILLDGTGSLTVSGGTLSGNSAADYGGSVYIDTTGTALFTTSSSVGTTVTGGTAGLGGGNFAIYGGTVTLTSPSVTSGLADIGGGLLLDAGSLTLTNAAFSNNIATVDGGGIYSNAGTISATGLTLSNNDAAADGGGAWLGANASLAGTISGNTALDGGGLFVSGGTTTLSGATVSGNDADYGGGVAIENSGALTMSSSSIATNTALEGAGVFNIGDLTCTGSVLFLYGIYDNVAVNDGGGVKMSTGSSSFSSTLCDFGTAEVLGPPAPAVNENFADGSSNDISLNDGTVVLYEDDATFVCSGTACTP